MASMLALIVVLVVGLIAWLAARHLRAAARQAGVERARILKQLQEIEEKRQLLVDGAARRGSTISTDRILKHVEDLKETYVNSGKEEEARKVERVIREFREQNGPEIPVDKAYALMKELEDKYGK